MNSVFDSIYTNTDCLRIIEILSNDVGIACEKDRLYPVKYGGEVLWYMDLEGYLHFITNGNDYCMVDEAKSHFK